MSTETMPPAPSNFVWYELHTFDAAAAEAFYSKVLGWSVQDSGMPGQLYHLLSAGTTMVAGVLEKPAGTFAGEEKTGWLGYLGVSDADVFTERVVQAGGVVHRPVADIPGIGRFSVVADPQGAIFVLMQPVGMERAPQPAAGMPGTFAWHDLAAIEWQAEFEFYSALFGWTKGHAVDMGSSGTYQICLSGETALGGMMTRMDMTQPPAWLYYVNVEDIDAAVARAVDAGGTITHGPSEVPGGQRIAHCLDPQGAAFGMVAPK